jgi:hypothetical protein
VKENHMTVASDFWVFAHHADMYRGEVNTNSIVAETGCVKSS